jgi:hypothetical protein
MNRIKIIRIVMVILSAMLLIGVGMTGWMLGTRDDREVVRIDLDGQIDPIGFENLCLIPGESCSYTFRMKGDVAKEYDVHLRFEETEEKTLKNFAFVRIETNGTVLCDELMATAFEGEGIELHVDLSQAKQQDLIITYYMPLEVGNEAQNAEAIFDLLITATNE